jgi:hypothetical protein
MHTPTLYKSNKAKEACNREELEGLARPGMPLRSDECLEIFGRCQNSRANGANS